MKSRNDGAGKRRDASDNKDAKTKGNGYHPEEDLLDLMQAKFVSDEFLRSFELGLPEVDRDMIESSITNVLYAVGEDPERAAQAAQASRLVHRALEKLTAKKRIVFVYHELCGMGPEEIAQAVGASYNTVRSRLHHARIEFTDALRELTRAEVQP